MAQGKKRPPVAQGKKRPPVVQGKKRPSEVRVIALVGPLLSPGFRLAGVEANPVQTAAQMQRASERLLMGREKGVVFLDASLFQQLPETLRRRMEESASPLFLPIPTGRPSRDASAPETHLAGVIRRAIGYQVKIRR